MRTLTFKITEEQDGWLVEHDRYEGGSGGSWSLDAASEEDALRKVARAVEHYIKGDYPFERATA